MLKKFTVKSTRRSEFIDITPSVEETIRASGVRNGIAVIHVFHTSAAITINENADPDVATDLEGFMAKLIPHESDFRHAEGNSDAHVKSSLFGPSITLIVEDGAPALGTWQAVYLVDWDGPRTRQYAVKVLAD
ncbi:MAG TPA: secondary thiamine-phosphate synthase enzyme YjbQ [bacterium]|nr:secondary thiamine-phosphate synthase enzyme YjbQ [bacterium]